MSHVHLALSGRLLVLGIIFRSHPFPLCIDLVHSIDTLFVKFETTLSECSWLQMFFSKLFEAVKLQDAIKNVKSSNYKFTTNHSVIS